jgi:hypothetical protein
MSSPPAGDGAEVGLVSTVRHCFIRLTHVESTPLGATMESPLIHGPQQHGAALMTRTTKKTSPSARSEYALDNGSHRTICKSAAAASWNLAVTGVAGGRQLHLLVRQQLGGCQARDGRSLKRGVALDPHKFQSAHDPIPLPDGGPRACRRRHGRADYEEHPSRWGSWPRRASW